MATYGKQMTVCYIAWDSSLGSPKTGDVANHTLRWIKDGTASAPTNSASEVDSTNAPGVYKLTLTATEAQTPFGALAGKSATANVVIAPVCVSFENIPDAAPGAVGGLPTVDANARVKANLEAIDSLTTNGNNATLNLKQLNIVNSTGTALIAQSSGSNGNGATFTGDGTGHGIRAVGLTGNGISAATTTGSGIRADGGTSGIGVYALGGATNGDAAKFQAVGSSGTSNGFTISGNNGGTGLSITGSGSGGGAVITGGTTGNGLTVSGGATSGKGFDANGTGGQPSIEGSITGNLIGDVTGSVAEATTIGVGGIGASVLTNDALNEIRNKFLLEQSTLNGPTVTSTTVTLDGSNAASDDAYVGATLLHYNNAGQFIQMREITDFDLATSTVTVGKAWTVNPVDTDIIHIYATAGTTLRSGRISLKKNVAFAAFPFTMYDSTTHTPATGLTVTAERSIDGGAFAACSNAVSEVSAGGYKIDLSATDMNGDSIKLKFTATGADQQDISIVTQE